MCLLRVLLFSCSVVSDPWQPHGYVCVCVCVCARARENHLSICGEREREIHTHNRKMLKNLSIRKPSEWFEC